MDFLGELSKQWDSFMITSSLQESTRFCVRSYGRIPKSLQTLCSGRRHESRVSLKKIIYVKKDNRYLVCVNFGSTVGDTNIRFRAFVLNLHFFTNMIDVYPMTKLRCPLQQSSTVVSYLINPIVTLGSLSSLEQWVTSALRRSLNKRGVLDAERGLTQS